jgi:transposase-like protein
MDAALKIQAEKLAREMATQATTVDDLNGLLRTMMKSALERMLNTEMDVHLGRRTQPVTTDTGVSRADNAPSVDDVPPARKNRRNGHSPKTVSGDMGDIRVQTPRDRDGTFEPQLIPKHQRRLAGFDDKILALYAKGMTTRDIQDIVQELYGVPCIRFFRVSRKVAHVTVEQALQRSTLRSGDVSGTYGELSTGDDVRAEFRTLRRCVDDALIDEPRVRLEPS